MTRRFLPVIALSASLLAGGSAFAQSQSLRGLTDATPNRLPSARQQLDQSRRQGQSDIRLRNRLDGQESLRRTDELNRANTRSQTTPTPAQPCPASTPDCSR